MAVTEEVDELLKIAFSRLEKIKGLHILAGEHKERIGVISFYMDNIHHYLIIRILKFGSVLKSQNKRGPVIFFYFHFSV